jgi:sucrose-6-phosphate hydrolase SacC (GH32 family)
LDLHIFIDKSVVEIFINGRETFTTVFYPKLGSNNALKIAPFFIRAQGGVEIDFWTLMGTNP